MAIGYDDDIMFRMVSIFIGVVFVILIGIIIFSIGRGIGQWNENNNSPILSVAAILVAKRTNVSHHVHHSGSNDMPNHNSSSTTYFVTFEVESGDRLEFPIRSKEYGMLAEGDEGILTFQGTRYIEFERSRN